jgi:hypothetical protein
MRAANRPKLNDDGRVTGVIVRAEEGTGVRTTRKSKDDVAQESYERYELECEVDGTTGPINMKLYVGTVLNPTPLDSKGRGAKEVKIYNQLTTLCLALGLINEDELENLTDEIIDRVESDFISLEGEVFSAKTEMSNGLHKIIPSTLRLVTSKEAKEFANSTYGKTTS